jgi:hypothetical protein
MTSGYITAASPLLMILLYDGYQPNAKRLAGEVLEFAGEGMQSVSPGPLILSFCHHSQIKEVLILS